MSAPLGDLGKLNRSRLHVFVAGPGFGEGIAVALPKRGWLLVDGCRTGTASSTALPLLAVLDRWRGAPEDDPVCWMVLTHPHEDHAEGFAELLDQVAPSRVGLMGSTPPARSLLDEISAAESSIRHTEGKMSMGQVLAAAQAMDWWAESTHEEIDALHEGFDLGLSGVTAMVRAPEQSAAARLLHKGWPKLRERANELSLVIELSFGMTRIVLGGDLPRFRSSWAPAPTGWDTVMKKHPWLAKHHGLKIPHHGSRHALHPTLIAGTKESVAWLTPYSSSRLPSPKDNKGLATILKHRPNVMLTALPTRRTQQRMQPHPAILTRQEYWALVQASGDSGFAADATDIRPQRITDPLGPVWATAFDEEAHVLESWRGDVALEIVA